MKNIWIKHKLAIIIAVYACIICLAAKFAALPYIDYIKNKSDKIQEKLLDNQTAQSGFGKISKMERDFNEFQQKKENLDVILEPEKEVDFIKKLENISQETGNKISLKIINENKNGENANAQKAAPKKGKDAEKSIQDELGYKNFIQIQIELTGNYLSLLNFVQKIENLPSYANIVSIDLKKETEEEKSEKEGRVQSVNIFSAPKKNSDGDKEEVANKKEILASVINIVVYVK